MTSGHTGQAAADNAPAAASFAREEKARLRRRIFDAAMELFEERDPRDVSMDAVAERAGVSEQEMAACFPTRSELIGDIAARLYMRGYPFEYGDDRTGDLQWLLNAYLAGGQTDEGKKSGRLIWQLGEELSRDKPGGPDAAYWHLVGDVELRIINAGIDQATAHRRAIVITPALMQVANRVAYDLTTPEEIAEFVAAACDMALEKPNL